MLNQIFADDRWVDIVRIDWSKVQINSDGLWCDVIYHKLYDDKIMLVYEHNGDPISRYAKLHDVELRTKPITHKKTLYLILYNNGDYSVHEDEQSRQNHISELAHSDYKLNNIDLKWEVKGKK